MATGAIDDAAHWDARYAASSDLIFGRAPNAWLAQQAGVWGPGAQVLCVADGEGRNSVFLAQQGLRVRAFDVSSVAVGKAGRLAAEAGVAVDFAVAGVDDYAWPQGALDGVAAVFVQFAGPALRERLFARMVQALKPGGTLLLIGYGPQQLVYATGGPKVLDNLYTPALLREAFEPTMAIDELREWEDELDEGPGHRGRSALVTLVARRR